MKYLIFILLTLNLLLTPIKPFSDSIDCKCYMNSLNFGNKLPIDGGNGIVNVSPENYTSDTKYHGKLVSVGGIIITQDNYPIRSNVKKMELAKGVKCPSGFRLISRFDLQKIDELVRGDNFWMLNDSNLINIPMNSYFFTHTKLYSNEFDEKPSAYEFYGTVLEPNQIKLTMHKYSSRLSDKAKITKCVMQSQKTSENIMMEEDLIQNMKRSKSIFRRNVIDYDVDMTGGINIRGKANFNFKPEKLGCFYMKIKWKLWEGSIVTSCESYIVRPRLGSNDDTRISLDEIEVTTFKNTKIHHENKKLHFNYATAPMSAKAEGGSYVFYTEHKEKSLRVMSLNKDSDEIKDFKLYRNGYPFSIQAIQHGFIVYYKERDNLGKSVLARYDLNGIVQWERTLINNGDFPDEIKEQIKFYQKKDELVNGMQAMFKPGPGKLSVGRKRIVLIFSHSNNFKAGQDQFLAFSGDSTISMDLDGNDLMLGDPWGTSHSLTQRIVYDGKQFVTSALGDGFPHQVRFTKNDGKHPTTFFDPNLLKNNRFAYSSTSDIILGKIPGNGKGQSCGRLGGLHVIGLPTFRKYAQIYSRTNCTGGMDGQVVKSNTHEIGVVFFDRNLKRLSSHVIGDGMKVNSIRSAKYGRNLFILYSTTCLLYTSPSPRDLSTSRMPSSA